GATMNELFNMESLYEEILDETDIDIEEIKELAEEKKVPDFSPVKVKINDSNIYTAIFETGDNKENMILANYYYNYLLNGQFDILENHKIYPLVEPGFVKDKKEQKAEVTQSKTSKIELIKDIIINIIKGFIFAMTLSLGFLFLKELFGRKLSFVFGYAAEDFDDFIVYDKQFNNEKSVRYFVDIPSDVEKLVLTEAGLNEDEQKLLFTDSNRANYEVNNSIEITSTSNIYDVTILAVQKNSSTRRWYNKQKEFLRLHEVNAKIV